MRIQNKTFYADLFSKSPAPITDTPPPPELRAVKPMAALPVALSPKSRTKETLPALPVPLEAAAKAAPEKEAAPAAPVQKPSALMRLIGNVNAHNISPRQMTDLSQTLYAAGAISFDDYAQLAFQPDLHPDFDRTIGALTGEHAQPDQPRDFVSFWNEQADFQRRHNARPDLIEQSERIASVLSQIETPMNVMA